MPLNSYIVALNYRKFSGSIPSQNLELTFTGLHGKNGQIENGSFKVYSKPEWIKIILDQIIFVDGDAGRIEKLVIKVAVDPVYADNLAVGYFQEKASIYFRYQLDGPNNNSYKIEEFNVNLRVTERQRLSLSDWLFKFYHTIGNAAPAGKFLTINTDGDWSITADSGWVNFSQVNGSGTSVISITPDVTGMASGVYSSQFYVDDGDSQTNGYVYVYVSGSGDEADYLNVTPSVLQFSETYLNPSEKENNINIDSSLVATIAANVNWLAFSEVNLPVGISQIIVSTLNTDLLQVGSYPAEITVTSNYSVRVIEVLLNVVQITTQGIESNSFYFSEDRNTILLTSGDDNSEVIADFKTIATLELKRYRKRAPFNKNSAQLIIGLETALYLRANQIPPVLFTQGFIPVKPISIDFSLFERSLSNTAMVARETFENLSFLNGNTPAIIDQLCYIPNNISVPKDGIIAFSLKSDAVIANLEITGAVTQTIPLFYDSTKIYGVIVNLSDYNLKELDAITITCGALVLNVFIKPTQLPTTQLIWQNEWDCPEIFNMDGIVEIIKENESKTVFTNRGGKEYASVIDSKNPKSFKVATGNIYTKEEVAHLSLVLDATKIWLQLGSERIEVIRKFKSLSVSETRRTSNNYVLSFDAAVK